MSGIVSALVVCGQVYVVGFCLSYVYHALCLIEDNFEAGPNDSFLKESATNYLAVLFFGVLGAFIALPHAIVWPVVFVQLARKAFLQVLVLLKK